MMCVPTSLSQEVGAALGAQAGEARLREVIGAGGFQSVRRATQTPFNMVLEARAREAPRANAGPCQPGRYSLSVSSVALLHCFGNDDRGCDD